jgi:trans-aconitate 2-methyltransferase
MRTVAAEPPFAEHIADAASTRVRVQALTDYYDLLAPRAASMEVWRTAYQHPMGSAAAIVSWVRATGLRPFVDGLPEALRPSFLTRYESEIARVYPARADGRLLLAFPRLFIVANRGR